MIENRILLLFSRGTHSAEKKIVTKKLLDKLTKFFNNPYKFHVGISNNSIEEFPEWIFVWKNMADTILEENAEKEDPDNPAYSDDSRNYPEILPDVL